MGRRVGIGRAACTVWTLIGLGNLFALGLAAQPAAAPTPQFDVVSIRPNHSNTSGGGMRPIAGGFAGSNLSVGILIQAAYDVKPWQIFGGPEWVKTHRYNIEAKSEGNPDFKRKLEMLRPLLADRFQLKFHRETRQMSVYSLVVAKGGSRLQPTAEGVRGYFTADRGLIEGKAVDMASLANLLGGSLGQSVVDRTGIAGHFDIKLEWTPTEGERNYTFDDRPIDPGGSSIFTALQEQLGLKLEAGKGPVEVFVIDHIERPSEN